jgi:putative peptidoglycan lipid II flippase
LSPPVPDSGSSDRGRDWASDRRDEQGWYDGPLYEDTGWHLDASDVSKQGGHGAQRDHERRTGQTDPGAAPFPPEAAYDRNGVRIADSRPDRSRPPERWPEERPAGRHARHGRADQDRTAPDQAAPDQAVPPPRPERYDDPRRAGYPEPERHRDYQGYQEPPVPSGYQPAPERSYPAPEPGYSRPEPRRDHPGYPRPAADRDFEPSPEPRRRPYPEPGEHYAEPGQRYPEPETGQFYVEPDTAQRYQEPDRDRRGLELPWHDYHRHPQAPPPAPAGYQDDQGRGQGRPYPPADPRQFERPRPRDGYLSMSDPADYSDSRRPDDDEYDDDTPGQPAFMRQLDPPPLYVEPPGQPYTEQTRILPALWEGSVTSGFAAEPTARDPVEAGPATGSFSIARSSSVMAVGTLASRLTGFLRTLVQVYVLGTAMLSNVYNNANTLPNVVYNLALGGILTSVIVPLIVNARKREADGGEAYSQRMFTLIAGALLGITLVATLAAAPLVFIYKGSIGGSNLHLMILFAYFFIPQIFFYGMSSLIGAVLNSRGSFAAPMWTPVINNLVVITVLGMYIGFAGSKMAESKAPVLTGGEVLLLGLGTTLGIAIQTAALVPAMRKVGFRWRPRFDFRRSEAAEIGRMGSWMFCYIAATQVAFLVTTVVCNSAQPGSGYTAYTYAWQLFQLPYAVVGISVITALLPRMSLHASEGRFRLVRGDFSSGVRLASVIVVPCSLVLAALGPNLALVFLDHGAANPAQVDYIGVVFAVFCLGLLPYMLFQLQLRVFYSLHDSKTPALIGVATTTLNVLANFIALSILPGRDVVAGLGVGFGLANLLGTFLAWRILSRRLRGLDGMTISGTLLKMHAAAIPGALFAITIGIMVADAHVRGRTGAAITIVVGGGAAVLLYLLFAKALRVAELTSLLRTVMSRFGR